MEDLRVLVIEDEFLVALDIVDTLVQAGFGNVVHAETESAALRHLQQTQWDAVVADANLNGKRITHVGRVLRERAIPFVVLTGYDREHLPVEIKDAPIVAKPVSGDLLAETVRQLCGL